VDHLRLAEVPQSTEGADVNGCTPFWAAEGWPCATLGDVQAIKTEATKRYGVALRRAREATGQRWPTELRQIAAQYHVDVTSAHRRLEGRL
jgi:hypothetical protein